MLGAAYSFISKEAYNTHHGYMTASLIYTSAIMNIRSSRLQSAEELVLEG